MIKLLKALNRICRLQGLLEWVFDDLSKMYYKEKIEELKKDALLLLQQERKNMNSKLYNSYLELIRR